MNVEFHPETRAEFRELRQRSLAEYKAMRTAIAILQTVGAEAPFPLSSLVQGTKLRELRPRQGRSPWRALYLRVGDVLSIGAIGPEAKHDPRGFRAAVDRAVTG